VGEIFWRLTSYAGSNCGRSVDRRWLGPISFKLFNLGEVYAMGRSHEGQLGIDQLTDHLSQPTSIPNLPPIVDIACGNHVSFAIDRNGKVHSFGAGTCLQHGHGQQDVKVPRMISSKYMDIKSVLHIAVGAQHTLFLTHDQPKKDEN
jgi:alpha-tubulin suppressor-like RCC1 family protein